MFNLFDFDTWLSIENRTHRPIKIENGVEISKTRSEYIDTAYCAFKYM
jgi:hypothetical protein